MVSVFHYLSCASQFRFCRVFWLFPCHPSWLLYVTVPSALHFVRSLGRHVLGRVQLRRPYQSPRPSEVGGPGLSRAHSNILWRWRFWKSLRKIKNTSWKFDVVGKVQVLKEKNDCSRALEMHVVSRKCKLHPLQLMQGGIPFGCHSFDTEEPALALNNFQ